MIQFDGYIFFKWVGSTTNQKNGIQATRTILWRRVGLLDQSGLDVKNYDMGGVGVNGVEG